MANGSIKVTVELSTENTICLFCKHFFFAPYVEGFSTYTPGHDMQVNCALGKWDFQDGESTRDARGMMLKARDCDNFTLSADSEELGIIKMEVLGNR